MLYEINILITW